MNQNHHPNEKLLQLFSNGELDDQVSLLVASHLRNCIKCKESLAKNESQLAHNFFDSKSSEKVIKNTPDFSLMEKNIFDFDVNEHLPAKETQKNNTIHLRDINIDIPPELSFVKRYMSKWKSFGGISYSKIDLHGNGNAYFIHFQTGAKIAEHSHDDTEYTYVVAGSFKDQHAEYVSGDFACFTHDHSHRPFTEDPDGCLLLVCINGPFLFKEGFARIINPFRNLFFKKL